MTSYTISVMNRMLYSDDYSVWSSVGFITWLCLAFVADWVRWILWYMWRD